VLIISLYTCSSPSFTLVGDNEEEKPRVRGRIVVLGTGWASQAFLESVDAINYDVVCVSPRNYFLHTPLLPSSAVGTVEYRSITGRYRDRCSKGIVYIPEAISGTARGEEERKILDGVGSSSSSSSSSTSSGR